MSLPEDLPKSLIHKVKNRVPGESSEYKHIGKLEIVALWPFKGFFILFIMYVLGKNGFFQGENVKKGRQPQGSPAFR
jgi:hypothetical protein